MEGRLKRKSSILNYKDNFPKKKKNLKDFDNSELIIRYSIENFNLKKKFKELDLIKKILEESKQKLKKKILQLENKNINLENKNLELENKNINLENNNIYLEDKLKKKSNIILPEFNKLKIDYSSNYIN
tara:strand:- start:2485 stop:2871 length:387 start_codon:yes stop_codon:yes gene_type:complete